MQQNETTTNKSDSKRINKTKHFSILKIIIIGAFSIALLFILGGIIIAISPFLTIFLCYDSYLQSKKPQVKKKNPINFELIKQFYGNS